MVPRRAAALGTKNSKTISCRSRCRCREGTDAPVHGGKNEQTSFTTAARLRAMCESTRSPGEISARRRMVIPPRRVYLPRPSAEAIITATAPPAPARPKMSEFGPQPNAPSRRPPIPQPPAAALGQVAHRGQLQTGTRNARSLTWRPARTSFRSALARGSTKTAARARVRLPCRALLR